MGETVFAFDGQGGAFPDMGKQEYQLNPNFSKYFDLASQALDEDVADICWGKRRFKLKKSPDLSHCALFASTFALFNTFLERDIYPFCLMGHSLGEVLALAYSAAVSLEEGARLIKVRGMLFE